MSVEDLSTIEIAKGRYLVNSLYSCRVCSPLNNNSHELVELPRHYPGGNSCEKSCCRNFLERSLLSQIYPFPLCDIIQSYTQKLPTYSFLTTPALPSQGLIECFILVTDEGFDLYLELKNPERFSLMREKILAEDIKYIDKDFEKSFPIQNYQASTRKMKKCQEYAEKTLCDGEDVFLMSARKVRRWNGIHHYIFSGKDLVGDLHSNFRSNCFSLYNNGDKYINQYNRYKPLNFKHELLTIKYNHFHPDISPIKMEIAIPNSKFDIDKEIEVKGNISKIVKKEFPSTYDASVQEIQPRSFNSCISIFDNLCPVWYEGMGVYGIRFDNHRIREKSTKNFKINRNYTEDGVHKTTTVLQFGRVLDRNVFVMDYAYPMSPLMAFGICLSTIQYSNSHVDKK